MRTDIILIAKSTIEAIRNRAAAQMGNYIVTATDRQYLDRWYTVIHIADETRSYEVDLFARTCTCEAFKREHYCKHCSLSQMERARLNRLDEEVEYLA